MNVFNYINSINDKKEYVWDEGGDNVEYIVPIVNKFFSYFTDTLLYAAEAEYQGLSGKKHYDFLYYAVPKGKRFTKWHKAESEENVEMISEILNISKREARILEKNIIQKDLLKANEEKNEYTK